MAAISITAASVVPSSGALFVDKTAAATITAGQAIYINAAGTADLADADAVSPIYQCIGIACNGASSGQPVRICTQDPSFTLGGTIAAGGVVILHTTAGAVCLCTPSTSQPTTGWYVTVLGVGIGSNKINLFPVSSCRADAAAA